MKLLKAGYLVKVIDALKMDQAIIQEYVVSGRRSECKVQSSARVLIGDCYHNCLEGCGKWEWHCWLLELQYNCVFCVCVVGNGPQHC